jgi:hypothetical protein
LSWLIRELIGLELAQLAADAEGPVHGVKPVRN